VGRYDQTSQLLERVLNWTIKNMHSNKGYFYYQVKKLYKIRLPYMRWSQAWMFYALSTYMLEEKKIMKLQLL
jgi:hypothetical protein